MQQPKGFAMLKQQQQSPSQRRPSVPLQLKTPQDFELRQPAGGTISQTSVPRTSSFASLSQTSSVSQLIDQSDQFFLVPGLDGALSREEFTKLAPETPEKSRHSETSFVEMAAARQSLCDLAEVARRKEQEWRTLQELRIRGLEDAVQGREQSLQQERRRFQRTVDELTAQRRQLELQLGDTGARSSQELQELHISLEQERETVRRLTQERDTLTAKLTDVISKHTAAETAAQELREENETLSQQNRRLEKEAAAARRSGDRLSKRLESAEQERERSADAELQMKVTIGKMEGYLKEEENTLETVRAELSSVKEAKETAELRLQSEKARVKEYQERVKKLDTELTACRAELDSRVSDKSKKIGFLIQGIRTLESDWKERYSELQRNSTAAIEELERRHGSEQERLLALVRSSEDRVRQAAGQAAAAQADVQRLETELTQAATAAATTGRERANERREAAQLLAARELSLAELRGKLERQQLRLAERGGRAGGPETEERLEESRRLLTQWQTAAGRLREYAEKVTAERDKLKREARNDSAAATGEPQQLERDNSQLRTLVNQLRSELDRLQRPAAAAAGASPHCSSCSSVDETRAIQLRQLLMTNAKLNETIAAQCETVRAAQTELERHRAAARSSEFLRHETAYLRSLLDGADQTDQTTHTETASVGVTPSSGGSSGATEDTSPSTVRELRYKLQLAARYIAHLGRERTAAQQRQHELERRLASVQRAPSLPADLDCLRSSVSIPSGDPGNPRGGAASFAELLHQLNTMQVETEICGRGGDSPGCNTRSQTAYQHPLSTGSLSTGYRQHGRVEPENPERRVPRLVGLGDCRSPAGGSLDNRSSSVTPGTGDCPQPPPVAVEVELETLPATRAVRHGVRSRSVTLKRRSHARKK